MNNYDPDDDIPLDEWMRRQPGRCRVCGWHIERMGHKNDCAVLARDDLPQEVKATGREVVDVPAPDLFSPKIERPW